jgi:hypothetical protein
MCHGCQYAGSKKQIAIAVECNYPEIGLGLR